MKITFDWNGRAASVDTSKGVSIAIEMQFGGDQPNHFGVDKCDFAVVQVGDFVGATERGGSCNVDQLKLIPHCNGTHTESVEHILNQPVAIGKLLPAWLPACLVSVAPVAAKDTDDSYRPELDHHDSVVTVDALTQAVGDTDLAAVQALVIRTLPNSEDKKSIAYGQAAHPAFLSIEAMNWIVQQGIQHLVLDLPSVDKMYDDGLLTNHHLFWNVPEGTHELTDDTRIQQTITEMAFVPDRVVDGCYVLNLQFPAFVSDAAPSRPVLYSIDFNE